MEKNKPTYGIIFKNRMFKLGYTQEYMGVLLAESESREKAYVKSNIEFYLKKTNDQWKMEDIKKWCKILKINFQELMTVCN